LIVWKWRLKFRPPNKRCFGLYNRRIQGVDFGFRDVIYITGKLCFPSILKFRASQEIAEMFEMSGNGNKAIIYRDIARRLKDEIPRTFSDNRGMLLASTGKSNQPDVWSTALAVYFGVLEGDNLDKTCQFLADSYKKGTLAYKGNMRHILTSDDFNDSTAWEISLAKKNTTRTVRTGEHQQLGLLCNCKG